MKDREFIVTERGLTVPRLGFKERLGYALVANRFGLAIVISTPRALQGLGVDANDFRRERARNIRISLDACQGVLQINRDFRKGKIDGRIVKADKDIPVSESPLEDLASYAREV